MLGARAIIKKINSDIDLEDRITTRDELNVITSPYPHSDTTKFIEDLFYILSAKCDGEAAIKVLTVTSGDGLKAYQEIYKWYTGTSGMAMTKRTENLMSPRAAKDDKDFPELLRRIARNFVPQLCNLARSSEF